MIPRPLNLTCRRFGTLYSIFIGLVILVHMTYEDGTDSVFRNVCIKNSDAGESLKRKNIKVT